ncbi:MAG: hypothetical protein ACLRPB_00850 [Lawsonibacter sp.]
MNEPNMDFGLMKEIGSMLDTMNGKNRPLNRDREPKDRIAKKKNARKLAKASRRRNRR